MSLVRYRCLKDCMTLVCKCSELWIKTLYWYAEYVQSKKYVTSYSNHNAIARSKSHENYHYKLFTTEDNNGFTRLNKRSWNKHLIKLITFKKQLTTKRIFCLLMHVHYILSLIKNIKKASSTPVVTCYLTTAYKNKHSSHYYSLLRHR